MKKKIIFFALTLLAIGAVGIYITKNAAAFKRILTINPWDAVPFVLLQIALVATNAFALSVYVAIFKSRISFIDSFGLNALNTFFNNILVKGGPFVKGYYLKKIHNLSYTDFILTVASFALIEVMVGGVLGVSALMVVYFRRGRSSIYLLLFFIGILAACYLAIRMPVHNLLKKNNIWVFKKISDLSSSWHRISADKAIMGKLFILAFLNFAIFALRLQYGFKILYGKISFIDCLLVSSVGTIGNLIALTPGALGIREFMVGTAYGLINGNIIQAVVVTVLDRVVATITIFVISAFFILYFLRKTKRIIS